MAAKFIARRIGVTLLELILALSLSVILLFAVGMALRLYWRSFDVKRTNVEQAHLARALLRKMEDDLRSAVQYTPVDLSGLESMTSASSLAGAMAGMTSPGTPGATAGSSPAGGSGATGASSTGGAPMGGSTGGTSATQIPSGQGGGGAPSGSSSSGATKTGSTTTGGASGASPSGGAAATTGGAAASGQAATGDPAATETMEEEVPPAVIGLYGSAYQLQFDVSRLPRVDEYGSGNPASMVQIPSDIKTLTYYVRGETSQGSGTISTFGSGSSGSTPPPGSSEPSTSGQGRGLMRLEMDRAVSAYSESNGSASSGYDGAKLLADEVTSIAFRYWDGTAWVSDWNSDEMGGLPLAVEIVMTMADANAAATTGPPVQSFSASTTTTTEPSYRIVVSLPTASLPPPVEEPTTETDPAAAGAAGATGAPGASPIPSGAGAAGASGGATSSKSGSSTSGSGSGSSSYGTGAKTGASK
ncbi:MAG: type II secretion system protein GspJ [Planctomycetales bacterium]|nr:type II secretion system protein GspJ [Planctomycetales bacterium]